MSTYSKTVTATQVISLGNANNELIGSFVVQLSTLSGTVAITPKGRLHGSGIASAQYATLAYTVGSTGVLTAGTTAISAAGVYFIRADGMDVFLDATLTSFSVRIDAQALNG